MIVNLRYAAGVLLFLTVALASGHAAASYGREVNLLDRGSGPRLIVDASVGSDFAALAQETWDQFLNVFAARRDCFGDVHLHASPELEDRAVYQPAGAVVTARVPGTAAMLQSALVHEWAHHVEFQCPHHAELRPAFLAAQGLAVESPWRPHDDTLARHAGAWAAIPSEQYAEAVVALVLGEWLLPTRARVTPAAIQVVRAWAAGHVDAQPLTLHTLPEGK